MADFGPFANIMALVAALVAVAGALVVRSLGPLGRWSKLVDGTPTFVIAAGPRVITIALIAGTYLWGQQLGGEVFVVLAVVAAIFTFATLRRFDRLRRLNVVEIPVVGSSGEQARDDKGDPQTRLVIIGPWDKLTEEAASNYAEARRQTVGLSLVEFMSGYGTSPNNPESLWPREVLVQAQMSITGQLMRAVVGGAMALFWAATAIDIGVTAAG